jgi:hypothetical protein
MWHARILAAVVGAISGASNPDGGHAAPCGASCLEAVRVWLAVDRSPNGCPGLTSNLGSGTLLSVYCHLKTLIKADEIEHSAQLPMFLGPPSEDLGCVEVRSAKSFRHYNPEFVRWAKASLIPRARDSSTCRKLQRVFKDTFAGTARAYYRAYKLLADKPSFFRAETARYRDAIARHSEDPADLSRLYHHLHDDEIDGNVGASALSFWIRRGIDGTKPDWYAALVEIMSDYDLGYLQAHPPVGVKLPSKASCTAQCDCDAPAYDRPQLDRLAQLSVCNLNPWPPPTRPVEIDGPARLRAEPNGAETAVVPASAEVEILEERRPWYRIAWGQRDTPGRLEGWTHASNINLAPLCELDLQRPFQGPDGQPLVQVTSEESGHVLTAFGRSVEIGVMSSQGPHFLFGTQQLPWALALFINDSDMYTGGFWLLGPAPPQWIPPLGRRSLRAIKADGVIELREDFHCMPVKHEGRLERGQWRRLSVTFLSGYRQQTISGDDCYVHPTASSNAQLPVARGTPVELLGITSDDRRIRVRTPNRSGEVFLPAGEVSRRCLSSGSHCAG